MYYAADGARQEDMTVFYEFDEDEVECIQIDNETEAKGNEVAPSNHKQQEEAETRQVVPVGPTQQGGSATTNEECDTQLE